MKRIAPIFGVLILILLLVLVNRGINKTAHLDTDDDAASSSQQTTSAKTAPPAPAAPGIDLPAEITIGAPAAAKYKITVGWVYDEANQASPQALDAALQTVQKAAQNSSGAVSAEIVNLDVPPSELSPLAAGVIGLGVAVNGQPITAANPGEPGATADDLIRALPPRLTGK